MGKNKEQPNVSALTPPKYEPLLSFEASLYTERKHFSHHPSKSNLMSVTAIILTFSYLTLSSGPISLFIILDTQGITYKSTKIMNLFPSCQQNLYFHNIIGVCESY